MILFEALVWHSVTSLARSWWRIMSKFEISWTSLITECMVPDPLMLPCSLIPLDILGSQMLVCVERVRTHTHTHTHTHKTHTCLGGSSSGLECSSGIGSGFGCWGGWGGGGGGGGGGGRGRVWPARWRLSSCSLVGLLMGELWLDGWALGGSLHTGGWRERWSCNVAQWHRMWQVYW